jgi:hypothetical protein
VLFSEGLVDVGEPVRFDSASGPLGARRDGDGGAAGRPRGRRSRLRGPTRFDYLVELADEAAVRDLAPGLRALGGLALDGVG